MLAIAAAVACQEEDPVPELTLDKTSASVDAAGGKVEFSVTSNVAWTAVSDATWVEVEPASGNGGAAVKVTATVAANDTEQEKTAKVTVTAETLTKTLTITQAAKAAVEPPVVTPSFAAGDYWIMAVKDDAVKVMKPLDAEKSYGYAPSEDAVEGKSYVSNVFTVTAVEGGYTIQDASDRYYYQEAGTEHRTFSVASELPENGAVWTIVENEDGSATVTSAASGKVVRYGEGTYTSFGAYGEGEGEGSVLPKFVKAENPIEDPVEEEYVFVGDGKSAQTAYTVEDAIEYLAAGMDATVEVWVKGTIVGYYKNNAFVAGAEGAEASNLALGAAEKTVPVQLNSGSDVRNVANLKDNPGNLDKNLAVKGKITKYFSVAGVKEVSEFELEGYTPPTATTATIADAFKLDKDSKVIVEATVVAVTSNGAVLADDTASAFAYGLKDVTVGDKVKVSGSVSSYNKGYQLNSPKVEETVSTGNNVTYPTPVELTAEKIAEITAPELFLAQYAVVQGAAETDSYNNAIITVGNYKVKTYYSNDSYADYAGKTVKMTGYVIAFKSDAVSFVVTSIEEVTPVEPEPEPEPEPQPLPAPADGNLVYTEGFEAARTDGWGAYSSNGCSAALSAKGEGNGSDYSLVITNPVAEEKEYGAQAFYQFPVFDAVEGDVYTFSFDVKTEAANDKLTVQLQQRSGDYPGGGYANFTTEAGVWKTLKGTFSIDANLAALDIDHFTINVGTVAGKTWIDNVVIKKKEVSQDDADNLISNAHFDTDVTGWGQWNPQEPSVLSWNETEGKSAAGSMEVLNTFSEPTSQYKTQIHADLKSAIAADASVVVSFWIKCKEGTGSVRCSTTGHAHYQGDQEVTTEWKQITWPITAGGEITGLNFDLAAVANTYYIDDVVVTAE